MSRPPTTQDLLGEQVVIITKHHITNAGREVVVVASPGLQITSFEIGRGESEDLESDLEERVARYEKQGYQVEIRFVDNRGTDYSP